MIKISGKVIQGKQRGKEIGFPTVNLELGKEIESGVYAGKVVINNKEYKAGIFIGSDKKMLEAHLIRFSGDLYDKVVEIEIGEKIREVMKFDSDDNLIKQIKKDIEVISN
jgi:FAD synthase